MVFPDRMSFLFPPPQDGLRDVLKDPRRFAKEGHGKVQSVVFGLQLAPHDGPVVLIVPERDHHAVCEVRQAVPIR